MNVKTLCLSILHNREATGYQIRNLSIKGKYGYFSEAGYKAIYQALLDLEKAGHASSHSEKSDGKPRKKSTLLQMQVMVNYNGHYPRNFFTMLFGVNF